MRCRGRPENRSILWWFTTCMPASHCSPGSCSISRLICRALETPRGYEYIQIDKSRGGGNRGSAHVSLHGTLLFREFTEVHSAQKYPNRSSWMVLCDEAFHVGCS